MKSVAVLAMSLGLSAAQVNYCSADRRPDWQDCTRIQEFFEMEGNTETAHINGEENPAPSCMNWWWDDGNCLISHCFETVPTGDEGTPSPIYDHIYGYVEAVRNRCAVARSGGQWQGQQTFLTVFNDEDGGPERRSLLAARDNVQDFGDGMHAVHSSLEDYLEWANGTADLLSEEVAAAPEKRQVEDDETFVILIKFEAVRHPDIYERGLRLSSGVGYEWQVTESQTYGVTTSAEMGFAWEAFSASAGINIEESETFSVTEGLTYDVDCPNQGQITFYPLFDMYEVEFYPSQTIVQVWIPAVGSSNTVSGEIAVTCLS